MDEDVIPSRGDREPEHRGCRLGSEAEERWRARIHPDDAAKVIEVVAAALAAREPYDIEYRVRRTDGVDAVFVECGFFDSEPASAGYATMLDVTARRQRERENWCAAHFDLVTGLPNRKLLDERIEAALRRADATGAGTAVLVININAFRETNAMYGRTIGNRLLRMLGERLIETIGDAESVAHLGLDIYSVLLTNVDRSSVTTVAREIITACARPFLIDDLVINLSVRVGMSAAPEDGNDPPSLLRCAYAAMSAVKKKPHTKFCWYRAEMADDAASAGRRRNELSVALTKGEFLVFYQPIVDLHDDRIVAVEALARWEHPQRGFISPAEFIALADSTGLIVPLGEWVLRQACTDAQRWCRAGHDVRVHVNVSATQFRQPDFASIVASILEQTGLAANMLELELTESVMVDGFEQMIEMLSRLKSLGIRLAIDDFGTGYSSLSYLKHFPIHTLKIDRAFVNNIATNHFDRAIATTVMTLATELGFECFVEGVETPEQAETLLGIGCRYMQGFLFYRPLTASRLHDAFRRPSIQSRRSPGPNGDSAVAGAAWAV